MKAKFQTIGMLAVLAAGGCSDGGGDTNPTGGTGAEEVTAGAPADGTTGDDDQGSDLGDVLDPGSDCEAIPLVLPGPDYDKSAIAIDSPLAQAWLGADAIPVRSELHAPDADTLPRIAFKVLDDEEVVDRLIAKCGAVLGLPDTPEVVDNGDTFSLSGLDEGIGYCRKGTGMCSCSAGTPLAGAAQIEDGSDAVRVALAWIATLELAQLPEHTTADVVGIGKTLPEQSYSVAFGFRYRGVPLYRDLQSKVVLTSQGGLARYMESVPTIAGERGDPIALIGPAELQAQRRDDYACYPMLWAECGYMAGSGTEAGVGCAIGYDNLDSGDPMTRVVAETINLSVDGAPPVMDE